MRLHLSELQLRWVDSNTKYEEGCKVGGEGVGKKRELHKLGRHLPLKAFFFRRVQ